MSTYSLTILESSHNKIQFSLKLLLFLFFLSLLLLGLGDNNLNFFLSYPPFFIYFIASDVGFLFFWKNK